MFSKRKALVFFAIFVVAGLNLLIIFKLLPYTPNFADGVSICSGVPACGHLEENLGKTKFSLICAVRNRDEQFKEALQSWLEVDLLDEIVIVDWSSSIPVQETLKSFTDKRIRIVTVVNETSFVLSRAYNLAACLASGDVLLKADSDTWLHRKFLTHHTPTSNSFYRGHWWLSDGNDIRKSPRDLSKDDVNHLNGVFVMSRHHFLSIHGYDERIQSYGHEDSDLYLRIEQVLVDKPFNYKFIHHIPHPRTVKASEKFTLYSNQLFMSLFASKLAKQTSYYRCNPLVNYNPLVRASGGLSYEDTMTTESLTILHLAALKKLGIEVIDVDYIVLLQFISNGRQVCLVLNNRHDIADNSQCVGQVFYVRREESNEPFVISSNLPLESLFPPFMFPTIQLDQAMMIQL